MGTIKALKWLRNLHTAWHGVDPEGGHDATADEYQAQLDAIKAKAGEPAAP